ncbi:MAG: ABC transporter ATP-binding protein [Pirellulales bacterium]|nr:ABC transporter ATP-binding protein [Pirellulales bacterium]
MISFNDVTKTYTTADGPVHALAGVSFNVPRGQFVAIQGPSGCGKSTLLMLAGTLTSPTAGRIVVGDQDVAGLSGAARARFRAQRIGFVFQMFHLLPYLNIVENVMAAASPEHKADALARAGELLERFRLGPRRGHRPAELSAGERQRVAVARALINRPDVLLADEPTGNLDPESASDVLGLLADFHRDGGTVLLVTHDAQAAAHAQETILLRDGAIAAK